MALTGWIAILVVAIMIYLLMKQYETRLVLLGGGLFLCCLSLTPMAGLNAFATTMTNGALITAICSATGFAYCVTYTDCDRSLVHYLARPIRNIGIVLVPMSVIITFFINVAIPSAVGRRCGCRYNVDSDHAARRHQTRRGRCRHLDGHHGFPAFPGAFS